jgi:hypothetical protein
MFRNERAWIGVGIDHRAVCISACVFILAGAVEREIGQLGTLGIHRPYFPTTPGSITTDQVKSDYKAMLQGIRAYLHEMNVSERLADDMLATEPCPGAPAAPWWEGLAALGAHAGGRRSGLASLERDPDAGRDREQEWPVYLPAGRACRRGVREARERVPQPRRDQGSCRSRLSLQPYAVATPAESRSQRYGGDRWANWKSGVQRASAGLIEFSPCCLHGQ